VAHHRPIQWVAGVLSPGLKSGRGVMLTTHPLLVPRLRNSGSYTSSHPNAPLRSVTGPLYLFTFTHTTLSSSNADLLNAPLSRTCPPHWRGFGVCLGITRGLRPTYAAITVLTISTVRLQLNANEGTPAIHQGDTYR
jgi:hypothetical protein